MTVADLDARTIDDAVAELVYGNASKGYVRTYSAGRVNYSRAAREAYSYGTHFPLFRYVPRNKRRPALFVINGDRWQGSRTRTPDHQTATRAAIARTGIPSIVLPFSALDGAMIDIDSVRPLDVRADMTFEETLERRTIAELPHHRRTYTEPVQYERSTLDEIPERYRRTYRADTDGRYGYGDALPDADGKYRWTEYVERQTMPDDDGIYRWTETRHRLGDALFTAERTILETRNAMPFEESSATANVTIDVSPSGRAGDGCSGNNWKEHTAGPDAACIHCQKPLRATITYRRRSRYLSSFDYNENPPLYFLCEVPRNGAKTVDGAIDSLAPRAVHHALLNGREVRRQGDVFFIDTALTRDQLVARGATFGRLTQWTRDAKPRKGEVTYVAPNPSRDKSVAAREARFARKEWKRIWTDAVAAATAHQTHGTYPQSKPGYRAEWTKRRAARADAIAAANRTLRRAILAGPSARGYSPSHYGPESTLQKARRLHVYAIATARANLDRALTSGTDHAGHLHNRHARDTYRARYGSNATAAWIRATDAAQRKYRPDSVMDHPRAVANRENVRRHLMVYGTSHSATEVARVGSAVYVRGTVSHAVTLETARAGGPDHRPIVLTADHYYLAVRNTVPRQNRRPVRRQSTPSASQ